MTTSKAKSVKVVCTNCSTLTEEKVVKLRAALADLVGVDGADELSMMATTVRMTNASSRDKAACLNAIQVLLETLPK